MDVENATVVWRGRLLIPSQDGLETPLIDCLVSSIKSLRASQSYIGFFEMRICDVDMLAPNRTCLRLRPTSTRITRSFR